MEGPYDAAPVYWRDAGDCNSNMNRYVGDSSVRLARMTDEEALMPCSGYSDCHGLYSGTANRAYRGLSQDTIILDEDSVEHLFMCKCGMVTQVSYVPDERHMCPGGRHEIEERATVGNSLLQVYVHPQARHNVLSRTKLEKQGSPAIYDQASDSYSIGIGDLELIFKRRTLSDGETSPHYMFTPGLPQHRGLFVICELRRDESEAEPGVHGLANRGNSNDKSVSPTHAHEQNCDVPREETIEIESGGAGSEQVIPDPHIPYQKFLNIPKPLLIS
jgi:hypothetical protein